MDKVERSWDPSKDITSIDTVFKEYRAQYLYQKKELRAELETLPSRGSVKKKKIGRNYYYYLVYRDGMKIKTDYISKLEPVELKKLIDKRRWILKQLKTIDTALYVLGIARRSQEVGQAKRFLVLERDGFACQYCGRNPREHRVALVVDHINPKKHGGENAIDNLITACVECNSGKRARLMKKLL